MQCLDCHTANSQVPTWTTGAYKPDCAGCHAVDGSGGTGKPLGSGSETVGLTDEQIASVIRVGPGSMPSFDRLTDEQIDSLVTYIRKLQQP